MVIESNVPPPAQEMETFLPPEENRKERIVKTYSLGRDVETGAPEAEFDPFSERNVENPTSNMDTLTHLLKASLGTGILAMPRAFAAAGLVSGVLFTIVVAVVCSHCAYILIQCAHILYHKTKKTSMSFPEVAEAALENGPKCLKPYAAAFRYFILISLFLTYYGTCSVYTVIIAKNLQQVVKHYVKEVDESNDVLRIFIIILLLPLILMVWIRNLKYLAPVSMIANLFMGLGLCITFYYLVGQEPLNFDKVKFFKSPGEWPEFFSLTIFAMEAIGVVMPLENSMKTPKSMLGFCGVLNKGMSGVSLVYMLLGFLGYMRYGDLVKDSITLSLTETEVLAQIVKVSIAIAVYCTFGLQFYVCVDIMWSCLKDNFTGRPHLAEYIIRTIMVTGCVLIAIAVPTIGPFMSVIGAFCFSILGLIAPAFIEIVTYWDIGFGPGYVLIWKNFLVLVFGIFSLVLGTKDAINSIIALYSNQ